jgi:putative DNA primase/helicase
MALNLVPTEDDDLSAPTKQRLDDLGMALITVPSDEKLLAYQHGAVLAFTCADLEGDARGTVSKRLEDLADRHSLVALAGGQDALQHILSLATRGCYALPRPNKEPRGQSSELSVLCVADVQAKPIQWLWQGRIARGKLTLLAGLPDLGKSQIKIDVAARISRGNVWPDGGNAPQASVLILSAEDSIADTIRPRCEAAGADLLRIHVIEMVTEKSGSKRSFSLQEDIDRLRSEISKLGDVGLIGIDPLTSYMGARIDSHRTTDVRGVLEPLARLAEETNVAVLGITHPPKAAQSSALHAFTGSLAYVAAARIAFLATEEPGTDRKLLLPVKNNIGARAAGLGYRLEQTLIPDGIVASRVAWDSAPVTVTANEAVRGSNTEPLPKRADAEALLREELASGPVAATTIEELATDLGISERTLRRARKDLGVVPKKDGFGGGWTWSLPDKPSHEGGQHGQL